MMRARSLAFPIAMLLAGCAAVAQDATSAPAQAESSAPVDQLTLLGTGGGPIARITRSQPANLLQVGDKYYLVDIGDGTPRQIVAAGKPLRKIDAVFITHLHFDHTAGLPPFIALDWQDRRRSPVTIFGPPGTNELVGNALRFLSSGEAIFRPELPDLAPIAETFAGTDLDVTSEREVYSDDNVRVLAVENSHYSKVHFPERAYGQDRSLSYRFETGSRSIVFTGDTGPSERLAELARGADVLVTEVIDLPAIVKGIRMREAMTGVSQQPLIDHMAQEHLTPENVGILAASAGVKKVVLTHFATPPGTEGTDQAWMLSEIRKHYSGEVSFGEDLATY